METLRKFLTDLSNDPSALKAYKDDPESEMDSAGLSDTEKDIVRSGDPARIRTAFTTDPLALVSVVVVVVIAVIK